MEEIFNPLPYNAKPVNLAIFASGTGSNAKKIIDYFKTSAFVSVTLVVTNNPFAPVIKIAELENIPVLILERDKFFNSDYYLQILENLNIHFIVLAGFLWKLPLPYINAYPQKIINIHPSLLPKYGGKNMYGIKVHETVISSGDKESGITIHFVDENYDSGNIIFQFKLNINNNETAASLSEKIHILEHKFYPKIIEEVIKNQFQI